MPEYHVVRMDQMTQAVSTFSAIETNPDGSTGGAIRVPQGVGKIKKIRVGLAVSAEVATDSGGVVVLRLSGPALRDGQQDLVVYGVSSIAQGTPATGIVNQIQPVEVEVDIPVKAGDDLNLSGAYNGVDFGTPEIGVEIIFG